MKFIKFGTNSNETVPTLYPVSNIESICLFNDPFNDVDGAPFKVILFLFGEDTGISERFYYDDNEEMLLAQKAAENRLNELLALLNT